MRASQHHVRPEALQRHHGGVPGRTGSEQGVEFFYSTPGVQLVTDDSGAAGVIGKSGSSYIKFTATKGVILSTGDYQNNQSLVERYCPDVKGSSTTSEQQDGRWYLMSIAVGAGFVPVGHSRDARLRPGPHVQQNPSVRE